MFKSKKYLLVHWVILIASVAMFVGKGTFTEWSITVCAFGGWYLKVNLDQKKIIGPNG